MPSTDRTDGQGEFTIPPPPPSNFVGRGYKYTTNGSSVYLDCFISLPVSRSTSSAHTYMPRLLHSSDCSTVPTFCTDNNLGSRVYFGIYRFSCFLLPTEFIGMTMSACCPSHIWIFCAFADNLMIMGLYRPDKLLVAVCPGPAISWPLIGRSFSAHWDKLTEPLSEPTLLTYRWLVLEPWDTLQWNWNHNREIFIQRVTLKNRQQNNSRLVRLWRVNGCVTQYAFCVVSFK